MERRNTLDFELPSSMGRRMNSGDAAKLVFSVRMKRSKQ